MEPKTQASFAVGIDLGTTNSALAYIDLSVQAPKKGPKISTLSVLQHVDVTELGERELLPSSLYSFGEHDVPAGRAHLPWQETDGVIIGEGARKQGSRVPSRLINSAKSWLSHSHVDRKAKILPWQADDSVKKWSPMQASAEYLRHFAACWNYQFAGKKTDLQLSRQKLVLTVPASFDEVARELTVSAASSAGLDNVILLEEPIAAFYSYLYRAQSKKLDPLPVGSTCVVVDCGGGTTDFSLISLREHEGSIRYERQAVGDHLLLGGDNMDLTLALEVEKQLGRSQRLDPASWAGLLLSTRSAKEALFAEDAPDEVTFTLLGTGRKLVGGAQRITLKKQLARELLLDGFFPLVSFVDPVRSENSTGLREFGLPFVTDPAITRHLAQFLRQHGIGVDKPAPTHVLFNGGVFHAPLLQQRILDCFSEWFGKERVPVVLDAGSVDLAVAHGACYFAWLKQIGGESIRSDVARSYYLGVGSSDSAAPKILCLVPHGLEEGKKIRLEHLSLELAVGEPVAFPLFSSSTRTKDRAGDLITDDRAPLAKLPPLVTQLKGGKRTGPKRFPVSLEVLLTEVGTLEIACVSKSSSDRWKLEFSTRHTGTEIDSPAQSVVGEGVWSEEELAPIRDYLSKAFTAVGDPARQELAGIMKKLEELSGFERIELPLSLLRALWGTMKDLHSSRKTSPEHEARWFNLTGFFLRPGWGDTVDPFRVEQCWKLVHTGPVNSSVDRVWTEYWIMLRRFVSGLGAPQQLELAKRLSAYLPVGSGKRKPPRRTSDHETSEIWRTIAACEALPASEKVELGEILLKQAKKIPLGRHVMWCLARLGSRVPAHGPANLTIASADAERWCQQLMEISITDQQAAVERAFAISQIARKTGDRVRDLSPSTLAAIASFFEKLGVADRFTERVMTVTELDAKERNEMIGDALPPGLTWISPA